MSFNKISCGVDRGNTGEPKCYLDTGLDMRLLLVPRGTFFATESDAKIEANWVSLLNKSKAERSYIFPIHYNAEDLSEEGKYSDGWAGKKQKVLSRKERIKFTLEKVTLGLHQQLKTFDGIQNYDVFIFTSTNGIKGTSSDEIKVEAFSIDEFNVLDETFANEDIARTVIEVAYADKTSEWDKNGIFIKPDWSPLLVLEGVIDVELIVSNAAVGGCTCRIEGRYDSVGFTGLVGANFHLFEDAVPDTPIAVGVTSEIGGVYQLTWPVISGAHSLTLFDQPIGTAGAESTNVATFSV